MSHDDWVFDTDFSPDQTRIASASRDGTVRLWDTTTGALQAEYRITSGEPDEDGSWRFPFTVAFSPSGELLAVGVDKSLEVWNIRTTSLLIELQKHTAEIYDLKFNPSGTMLASSGFDGTVRLWGIPAGED
jgi:WD40 repeat protein